MLILTILTIGSGCVATPRVAPLCIPDRPYLDSISEAQLAALAEIELITVVATNDLKLKAHIKLLEELIKAHNNQLGTACDDDT